MEPDSLAHPLLEVGENYGSINVNQLVPAGAQDTVQHLPQFVNQPVSSHSWPDGFFWMPWEAWSALGPLAVFLLTLLLDWIRAQRRKRNAQREAASLMLDRLESIESLTSRQVEEMVKYQSGVDFYANRDAPLNTATVPFESWLENAPVDLRKTFVLNKTGDRLANAKNHEKLLGLLRSIRTNVGNFMNHLRDSREERNDVVSEWNLNYTDFYRAFLMTAEVPELYTFLKSRIGDETLQIRREELARIGILLDEFRRVPASPQLAQVVVSLNLLGATLAKLNHLEAKYAARMQKATETLTGQLQRLRDQIARVEALADRGIWKLE